MRIQLAQANNRGLGGVWRGGGGFFNVSDEAFLTGYTQAFQPPAFQPRLSTTSVSRRRRGLIKYSYTITKRKPLIVSRLSPDKRYWNLGNIRRYLCEYQVETCCNHICKISTRRREKSWDLGCGQNVVQWCTYYRAWRPA